MNKYRLGIDLGANSLGWCALTLGGEGQPNGILDLGVRLFADGRDPKTGTSLAADRRAARQMRRRRDRFVRRRETLMNALVRHGLMPADKAGRKTLEALDPYALRAKGLDARLDPHELGRALFHLNQRRGFKSSRKAAGGADEERGLIDSGIQKLKKELEVTGARTVGEFLARRHSKRDPVRVRPRGKGAKAEYDFYPQRALIEDEFEKLWVAQMRHHASLLTEEAKAEIRRLIFHQRPLRPVDPGRCTLDPSDPRAPRALPLAQRFRMLQELNNLEIVALDQTRRRLTRTEREKVFAKLVPAKELTFEQMRRLLGLEAGCTFNLESEKRRGLKGDATGRILSDKKRFGKAWWTLLEAKQDAIVETILAEEDEEALARIAHEDWGLDPEAAQAVARVSLPEGYASIGRRAMEKIVPILRDQGIVFADAARAAGYEPSDFRADGSEDELPDYREPLARHLVGASGNPEDPEDKRFGRFPNPTVHIGLNQTREIVNALIEQYGKPAEIVVELARELKLNRHQKDEVNKRQAGETERNEKFRAELASLGLPPNRENMLRLKLWEELGPVHDRCCIYTGAKISKEMLFGAEVAIDHILPFKDTLDDGVGNLLLCLKRANDYKGKRTPFAAFGQSADGYDWRAILLRAENLPKNKRERFAPDALERFNRGEDFIARQLTDTAYLARIAREYLGQVCPSNKVWAVPGRLTALLRGKWGLNGILSDSNLKNRADHRHHAIDAFVVACTDRSLLKRMSDAAVQARLDRALEDVPDPWEGFDRDALRDKVRAAVVSLRPDHGRQGRLHEETAYGLITDPAKEEGATVVYRKPFADLNENEVARIRDKALRMAVQDFIAAQKASGKTVKEALAAYAETTQYIRHVRLLKTEDPASLVPIRDRQSGEVYKAMSAGENWCIDLYAQPDGKWAGVPITLFQANQPGGVAAAVETARRARHLHPAARKVMRIHKGDYLKLEHDGIEKIMRVVRLEAKAERLRLAPHNEAGELDKRHNDPDDPFRWVFVSFNQLRLRAARKVAADPLGRVHDPGPTALRMATA